MSVIIIKVFHPCQGIGHGQATSTSIYPGRSVAVHPKGVLSSVVPCLRSASMSHVAYLLFLVPRVFHCNTCLVMLFPGFQRVCPIWCHLRCLISSIGLCFVFSHSSSFLSFSCHLIFRIFWRHLLTNVCTFLNTLGVAFHISHPHSSTDFTFELVLFFFFFCEILLAFHIFCN